MFFPRELLRQARTMEFLQLVGAVLFVLALGISHAEITYTSPPPFGGDCWSSIRTLNFWELGLLQGGGENLIEKRIYNLCPDSVIQIGTRRVEDTIEFEGGDMPFVIINPNVNIRCGETGERHNNCTMSGGEFQLAAYHPAGLLPENGIPNSSNLIVEGVTFENFASSHAVTFTVTGQNMELRDCEFKNSNTTSPPKTVVSIKYTEENDPTDAMPWVSLTILDSTFENNVVKEAVVATCACNDTGAVVSTGNSAGKMDMTVEGCIFRSNSVTEEVVPPSVVKYDYNSTGSVTTSCFFDNTAMGGGAMVAYHDDDNIVVNSNNYGENNTAADCDIWVFDGMAFDDGNRTCTAFSASQCQAPVPTPSPAPSPESTPEVPTDSPAPATSSTKTITTGATLVLCTAAAAVLWSAS